MLQILYAKGLQAFLLEDSGLNFSISIAENQSSKGFQGLKRRIQCLQGF